MVDQHSAYKQASRYLALLEAMGIEAQRSFRKIYALAPHHRTPNEPVSGSGYLSRLSGRHVRTAMMETLAHPEIAYWVRMNLALRVARKLAQVTGRQERIVRINEVLECFHVAVDAFICKLPIDLVMRQRALRQNNHNSHPFHTVPTVGNMPAQGISPADLDRIQQFKRNIIPGFIKAIREKHREHGDGDFAGA